MRRLLAKQHPHRTLETPSLVLPHGRKSPNSHTDRALKNPHKSFESDFQDTGRIPKINETNGEQRRECVSEGDRDEDLGSSLSDVLNTAFIYSLYPLHAFLPTILPPYHPSSLPSFLPPILPPTIPSFLRSLLPMILPPSIPSFLPTILPPSSQQLSVPPSPP